MSYFNKHKLLKRFLIVFAILFLLLLFAYGVMNIMTHYFFSYKPDPDYNGPSTKPPELLEYYNYPKHAADVEVDSVGETNEYIHMIISFPLVTNPDSTTHTDNYSRDYIIYLDYFENKDAGKFPTILLLPTFGGVNVSFASMAFADYFVPKGFNCAIFRGEQIDFASLASADYVEGYLRRAVLNIRQLLDYLTQEDKVDSDKIGCVGLSLGGIEAVCAAAVDERLKCCVIALAGGSMADIICKSGEPMIKSARRKVIDIRDKNNSLDELHSEFEMTLKTDPLKLAPYVDARNVLMINAYFDNYIIPRKCSNDLWLAIGKPEMFYVFSDHFNTSFLYLPYAKWRALHFFKDKL